ncbi:hypothetical protein M758_UG192100 [Ceratodon purpureus]|nr:hypothetical protein M758_UG192100 [Ceratodon purpureus]
MITVFTRRSPPLITRVYNLTSYCGEGPFFPRVSSLARALHQNQHRAKRVFVAKRVWFVICGEWRCATVHHDQRRFRCCEEGTVSHVRNSPQNIEDLRPWLSVVDRARRCGMDIPPLRYIAPLLQIDADWRWTVACAIELLDIIAASGISYPLRTSVNSEVDSNSVVESEDSVSTYSENVPTHTYHLRQPYSYARYSAMNHRHTCR